MQTTIQKSLFILLGSSVLSWSCNASHVLGAGGSGAVYTMSADTMEEGGFYMGINAEKLNNHVLSDAEIEDAVNNGAEHIHSIDNIKTYSLSLSYGITDDVTLNMSLPYLLRNNVRAGEHHDAHTDIHKHGDIDGIGDMSAILQYKMYDEKKTKFALLAGIKAPTGKTDLYDGDELLEADLQPGSGSWDYFAGAALSHDFEHFSLLSSALYQYNGEGDFGSTLGDIFSYNVAFSYKVIEEEHDHVFGEKHEHEAFDYAVDVFLEFNGEYVQTDSIYSADVENTGHHIIFATTGVQFTSNNNYSAYAAFSLPVYEDYTGIQNEIQYKFSLGIGKSF